MNCVRCETSPVVGTYSRYCDPCRSLARRKPVKYAPTPHGDELIREAYRKMRNFGNRDAIQKAATRLCWPAWKVKKRGRDLGLARTKEAPWTDAEIEILERYSWMCAERIAGKLKAGGYARTATGVHLKRKRMRLLQNRDWFTANQLGDAFGCDPKKVTRWIAAKILVARRRETERTAANGGDMWMIERRDVQKFVLACPDEYDLAKVEKFWFLDLITDGRICR